MVEDRPLLLPSPLRSPLSGPHADLSPPAPVGPIPSSSRRSSGAAASRRATFAEDVIDPRPSSSGAPPPPRLASRGRSGRAGSFAGGSYREINDDDARLVVVGDPDRSCSSPALDHRARGMPDNSISTAKYSILTFLPRNLFEQFHRVAYVYFLALACLNQVPQLAVFASETAFLPLIFVLGVTAVKDGYEDLRRHRSDRLENSRPSVVLSGAGAGDGFVTKPCSAIRVGEVVRVVSNETIPCDMVLLATSDPTGVAYIQTVNLDGESNLKTRYAKQEAMATFVSGAGELGVVRCERPNRNIYGFHANLELPGGAAAGKRASLGPSNIVLRGCELKNTEWAVGVAVYTGKETKVMLNNSGAPSKRSRLERHMNRETLFLAALLAILCSVVAALGGAWLYRHRTQLGDMPYYRKYDFSSGRSSSGKYNYYGAGAETAFTFLRSVIVFQVLIPIALYVSMELVRVGQAFFMVKDKAMGGAGGSPAFQCRALNINEDLGMVKYVFSDKTGTLTENKMDFRRASVLGVDYDAGAGDEDDDGAASAAWGFKTAVRVDRRLRDAMLGGGGEKDFAVALAACNTIVPMVVEESPETGKKVLEYQGESPDEQALAYAAAAYGYVLVERSSGHVIVDVNGESQRFDILGLHEFDSDRKRMSVIVGCPDKTVKLFVKGADSSMFGVIDKSINPDVVRATESHLHTYSSLGLRTLVIGMRELSSSEFEEWQSAYEKASTALFGRGSLLRTVAANIESNLQLLGATGIEDKLQQGVPEAIESLRQAGMKVWVLTGDKQETAISIGYSCKLLTSEMTQIVINSRSRESCRKSLEDAMAMANKLRAMSFDGRNHPVQGPPPRIPLALIIDGTSLVYILETEFEAELFDVATRCDVVLCCRVAPLQKAGIVALIKNRTDDMTLAIGDGANDVSMIQMADVGIGISGQEGRQAVMASDFAMGQFRFLVPLLLVHGHWNYQRMAYMILYNFYRNAVFVFTLFWFVLHTAFSLTTAITEWSSVLFSVVYTALPTIVVGILDKDLSRKTLLRYPQLYGVGQREERYNLRLFVFTMMDTLWQSTAVFFIPYLAYRHSDIDISGLGDLWTLAVVILVNLHLGMDVFRWNWLVHVSIWGCIAATTICVILIDAIPILPGFGAIFHIMGTGLFWFLLLAIVVVALIPRFVSKVFIEYFRPNDIQVARELEKFGDSNRASVASTAGNMEIPMSTFNNLERGFIR